MNKHNDFDFVLNCFFVSQKRPKGALILFKLRTC